LPPGESGVDRLLGRRLLARLFFPGLAIRTRTPGSIGPLRTVFTSSPPLSGTLGSGTGPTAAAALEDPLEFILVEPAVLVGISPFKQRAQSTCELVGFESSVLVGVESFDEGIRVRSTSL